jgi:D-3-phosphoglycerate dehydrogenase
MSNISILIIDDAHPVLLDKFKKAGFSVTHNEDLSVEEVYACIHEFDGVIIRSKILANKEFIDKGTNLKCIGRVGAGMETVDIPYAESKGIVCFNSPEGNRDAVGEQAIGVLLSLMNNLNKADQEVRNLIWDREGNRGIELKGRTVGIIGYGNMGGAFAKKLSGFECNVIAYDKYKTNYSDAFAQECSLQELQQKADIISLHVPQTDETIGMVNAQFIEACAKAIILINTARGKVVNTQALVDGMKSGKVFAAGLDVLEYESYNFQDFLTDNMPEAFQYLQKSNRMHFTPHIAGWTVESKEKLSLVLADKIVEFFKKI